MASKYQTLTDFLLSPFHSKGEKLKDTTYETKYRASASNNEIQLFAMCIIGDSYYLHVKVPSESKKSSGYKYDVIIRFFPPNDEVSKQTHIRNYYIQFFSNSPSFMYQFAYVYKQEGFLIETLYDKLDPDYIDTPPDKTNADRNLSYDKSIYFACKFLSDKKFRILEKNGPLTMKKVSEKKFFSNINDFRSIKVDQTLINEERKLAKELDKGSEKKTNRSKGKITPSKNTSGKSSINIIVKKGAKGKITAKRSTRK